MTHKLLRWMTRRRPPTGVSPSPVALTFATLLSVSLVQNSIAEIVNTVTVTGSFGGSPITDSDIETADVEDASATLTVTKSGILNDDDGVAGETAGDTITWTIAVQNNGNVSIDTITVTDSLGTPVCPTSGNDTIASLGPTEIENCTVSYVLTQSDFDTDGGGDGDIDNLASASGTADGGIGAVSDSDTAEVAINATSSVSLVKLADDDTLRDAGDVITYTYTVTNTGNQTLTNISLSDVHNGTGTAPLPDADSGTLTDNRALGDSSNLPAANSLWDQLGPGDVVTVTATYTVTQDDVDTLQ